MESAPLFFALSQEEKNPRSWFLGDFFLPSFPRPSRRPPQRVEQFAFGLLHALCGFGVAAGGSDALQNGQGESRAQVLLGLGQGQQRLQRRLVAAVHALLAAFFVDFDFRLARTDDGS